MLMNVLTSLIAVILLALIPFIGIELIGLDVVLGIVIPYIALALFITGITLRILIWTKVPVPFNITTSCGQQKTLPWFKSSPLESPHNIFGVIGRMLLEILIFRSLLRNTSSEVKHNPGSGPKVVYRTSIWLWLGAMAFHWTFLIIVFRHLRFFTEPEFPLVGFIERLRRLFTDWLPYYIYYGIHFSRCTMLPLFATHRYSATALHLSRI